jgi:hypothetical protein
MAQLGSDWHTIHTRLDNFLQSLLFNKAIPSSGGEVHLGVLNVVGVVSGERSEGHILVLAVAV